VSAYTELDLAPAPEERRPYQWKSRSLSLRDRLSPKELVELAAITAELGEVERPRTRGECMGMERPCPFVGCRYHLYLDVNPDTGTIRLNFPDKEVWELKETCALDVADRGGEELEVVGGYLNLSRQRIEQIEKLVFKDLRNSAAVRALREDLQE
jgi:hypothetical protein